MKYIPFILITVLFSCGSNPELEELDNIVNTSEVEDSIVEIEIDSIPLVDVPMNIDYSAYENIAFGFGDLDGDSVILLDKPDGIDASNYKYAFSTQGKLDIKHLKSQQSSTDDNGRLNSYNFKNIKGELYEVTGSTAPLWESILFVPTEFIQARKHLAKSSPYNSRELSTKQASQIESDKNWPLKTSQHIASYAEGSLYFAEFEKRKDSVMVSVVWIGESENTYLDFPAEYNEMSTWRVDDGGIFDFELFKIITVFESDQGIEILTDWVGAEGSSVNYYLAADGKFETVKSAYFYSAPL